MSLKWKLAYLVLHPLFGWLFRAKVYGKENIPEEGPYIVAPNHTSFWDPPFVGWAMYPVETYFLAKIDLFQHNKLFGALIKWLHAIPLDRENSLKGLRQGLKLLKEGKVLVVFPEGTRNRTKDKVLLPLKEGVALLALKAKVNILPVFLYESKGSYWDWILGKRQLAIRFGKIIDTSNYIYSKADIKKLTKELERRLLSLAKSNNA